MLIKQVPTGGFSTFDLEFADNNRTSYGLPLRFVTIAAEFGQLNTGYVSDRLISKSTSKSHKPIQTQS